MTVSAVNVSSDDHSRPEGSNIASFVVRVLTSPSDRLVAVPPTGKLGWLGRVEHVQSRRSAIFQNPEQMIAFIEACLGLPDWSGSFEVQGFTPRLVDSE
jgi:hypothetical protein